jgi:hypothetical protein
MLVSTRGLIFHMSVLCDKTFPFCIVTLTFVFDILVENIFWVVGTWALIFHMSVPCDDLSKVC